MYNKCVAYPSLTIECTNGGEMVYEGQIEINGFKHTLNNSCSSLEIILQKY